MRASSFYLESGASLAQCRQGIQTANKQGLNQCSVVIPQNRAAFWFAPEETRKFIHVVVRCHFLCTTLRLDNSNLKMCLDLNHIHTFTTCLRTWSDKLASISSAQHLHPLCASFTISLCFSVVPLSPFLQMGPCLWVFPCSSCVSPIGSLLL